jgi:murein DD-endopeptidase MepM/ murein hydrolase activator NlpD
MHSKLETPSVLGRVARSRAYSLQRKSDDDPDEAAPSPATLGQIRAYFDAWRIGDEADQERALDKIVKTWRADNAAGGLPVHAHLPLPGKFAKTVAQLLESGSEVQQRPTVDRFIVKLDPSVRVLITHQLATLMERKLPGVEEHGPLPADAGERSRFHSEADAMRWPKHVANADGSDEGLEDVTASIGSARERAVLETRGHGVVGLDAPGDWAIAARPGARSSALDVAEALDARELGPQKNDERVVDDTARPRVRTLEFDPKEDASNVVPLRYVDDEGNIVYEAWELPDGSMPPPRPAYNKMLPIQSTIPNRQRPHGYSSGEYDPTRVGLRKSIDKKTGRVVFKPHHGVDFRANYGDPIRVAADGVVVGVANNVAGYGTVVAVRHPDGTMTLYAHLVPGKVLVRPGQYIRVGTFIGQAGTSGNAGRPQVHFEVWRQAYLTPQGGLDYNRGKQNTIDPYKWFDRPMMPGFTPRHKPTPW